MTIPKFVIEKVYERDVDLLLAQSFLNDSSFKDIFLSAIGVRGYDVVSVEHSLSDNEGESDLTIILSNGTHKIAFLIEDKIDAIAMPNQYQRYTKRGDKGIESLKYDDYFVFIVAPSDYLNSNLEAKKYAYSIAYEQLADYYQNTNTYGYQLILAALERKKKGYSVIEDKEVTEFWNHYYRYVKEHYPKLRMYEVTGPRGSNAIWPAFLLPVKGVRIQHKSNKGVLDLEFSGLGNKYQEFANIVNPDLDKDMRIERTGKSLSIRLEIPIVNFKQSFDIQSKEMKEILEKAMRLYDLLLIIDMPKVTKLMTE